MGNNDLKILITANLNIGKSIGELNTQIKALQTKVNSLRLTIKVDERVYQTLNNFSKQMQRLQDSALNAGKVIEEALMPDGTKIKRTHFDGIGKEFQEIVDESKKLKSSIQQTTNSMDSQIKTAQQLAKEIGKVTKETETLNAEQLKIGGKLHSQNDNGSVKRVVSTDGSGQVNRIQDTYDYLKDEKEKLQLIEQMAQFREQSELKRREREREWDKQQQFAIQKNADLERTEIVKTEQTRQDYVNWWIKSATTIESKERQVIQTEKKKTEELEHQLHLYKQQAQLKVADANRRLSGLVKPEELNDWLNKTKTLKATDSNLRKEMSLLDLEFKKIESSAKNSTKALDTTNKSSISLISAFETAMVKFPVWIKC